MDYTHFRWLVRTTNGERANKTVTGKNAMEAIRKLDRGEKLGEKIGGFKA